MFASLLPALTLVALGLLVPAGVVAMVLARGRHASVSSGGDRGGRVAVAAGLAAVAGGTVAWLLDAGLAVALLTSLLLAAPVVIWAYLAPWWPVRAVVAWAMLVTGSVGAVGLLSARALESADPWTALPVAAVGSTATVFVLERLNGPFRRLLGIRAGIRRAVRTPVFLRPALLRPALAVAVFFAALAAGGLTGVAPRPGDARSEAGAEPDPRRGPGGDALDADDVRTVSADVTTPSESVGMVSGPSAGASPGSAPGSARGGPATDGAATAAAAPDGAGSATTATRTSAGAGSTSGGSTAGGTSGSTGDSGGTGGTGEPVRTVTDTVSDTTETVRKTTDTVVGTVEKTGDSLADGGGTATEPVRSVVEETVEPVGSVVEDTTEPVTSVVDETVDQVTEPLGSALP